MSFGHLVPLWSRTAAQKCLIPLSPRIGTLAVQINLDPMRLGPRALTAASGVDLISRWRVVLRSRMRIECEPRFESISVATKRHYYLKGAFTIPTASRHSPLLLFEVGTLRLR